MFSHVGRRGNGDPCTLIRCWATLASEARNQSQGSLHSEVAPVGTGYEVVWSRDAAMESDVGLSREGRLNLCMCQVNV